LLLQLSADTELPVKNGAELLDRLIKDIVTEQASTYVSATSLPSPPTLPHISGSPSTEREEKVPDRAFSLARFIPLLQERIYVINPFTRTYLVSWLTVLDSVPELELVSFLPDFLDGLLKFLGDPNVDIRTATQNVLADFLRETREVAEVQKMREEEWRNRHEEIGHSQPTSPRPKSLTLENEDDRFESPVYDDPSREDSRSYEVDEGEGSGAWIPGQGVKIDHAAIVEILLQHLSFPGSVISSLSYYDHQSDLYEHMELDR
jgi:vacuole morphology and inheritance protein 14